MCLGSRRVGEGCLGDCVWVARVKERLDGGEDRYRWEGFLHAEAWLLDEHPTLLPWRSHRNRSIPYATNVAGWMEVVTRLTQSRWKEYVENEVRHDRTTDREGGRVCVSDGDCSGEGLPGPYGVTRTTESTW